ncbi:4-aminobutyrate--2-oxoglutarate transaminase [Pseudidiomarina terrestris]|uniref:4-aminobutyrate--2-oxoglutarate transaminase n=1 Tax=Pseudidiomarina terrestris TaxID=2820060 RepID=UPI002651DDE3|nr:MULTISPECIES: 4-aminobutyrate--2-oxoglutarate transaminase [unclassified Pseudidiomarina]MDN7126878.1 4-aminobutyrate--2-oxoglutarate transaminase [Pseudidiomarina sp. 1APR75-33.1]MDN7134603.1 4-aminobutyrate--2-oxoglutarate transaminase [Pseudidiomarina sp. 1ASP75-5]MEA3587609.1 4-aminobutyrate--2-oxoglutarate transaminase [Pseudidiomarina sp. 1APP75-27a]
MTNQELQQRKLAAFARGQGNVYPVYVTKAKNAEVWDVEGNRYIDLGTGIAVCNTGHSHPQVVKAAQQQLEQFSHSCVMINPYEVAVELAEKLTRLAPGPSVKKAMFVTTGAEAVENCVKIARAATGRRGVIAFTGGFHGRTNMTMGLTGKVAPYKHLFGPFPADIYHAPFPVAAHGVSEEDALKGLQHIFKAAIAPSDVAAIIIEPVQGEGGFYPAPASFMQALRKLCDDTGIVLIADEIQTGFARTGKLFCCEHSDVEPDLITMAKGIAGGLPLAAVVGKAELMDAPLPGGLGGTYGGSPVACAAALAVLEVIAQEDLCQRATHIGALFNQRLGALQKEYPESILEVRQTGAMVAIELVHEGDPEQPDTGLTQRIIKLAPEHGLILLACGYYGNVIRFLPALTIEESVLNEALDQFEVLFCAASSC